MEKKSKHQGDNKASEGAPPEHEEDKSSSTPDESQSTHPQKKRDNDEGALEQELEKLQEGLKQKDAQFKNLSEELKACQDDEKALEAAISDFKKITETYENSLDNIQSTKDELETYRRHKTTMVYSAVGDHLAQINDIKKEINDQLSNLERKVKKWLNRREGALGPYREAEKTLKQKTNSLNALKSRQKTVEDNLKALENLKKSIDKEEQDNQILIMGFLMQEFEQLFQATKGLIIEKKELKNELVKAWQEVSDATTDLRAKKSKHDNAVAKLSAKEKKLEKYRENRREKILTKLSKIKI
ncbi:hypothetical protein D1BOALGB6SA_7193 [Olavius sp. associated proteobacterium Delta 1]|nr:hypothetical protein D1BOALGB6SA_7193 [Olavius sp. associated proteobacterium Delta 1]